MSDHILIQGTIEAEAGVLREHTTEREYPFVMEAGDILHVGDGNHIEFTNRFVFNSRDHQDQFVNDWKQRGVS